MKYIKKYEDLNLAHEFDINESKRLLSHLIKIFNEIGYDNSNYYDRGKHESEFFENSHFLFLISVEAKYQKILSITISILGNRNETVSFIPKYFDSISGLKKLHNSLSDVFDYEIIGDVDDIIDQISTDNFEIKINSNKYNL